MLGTTCPAPGFWSLMIMQTASWPMQADIAGHRTTSLPYARCSAGEWQDQCHSCHAVPGNVTKSTQRVKRTRSSTTARRRVDARSRVRPSGIPVSPCPNLEQATLAGDDVCACQQSPRPALSSRMQQRCLRSGIIHSGGSAADEQRMFALSGGSTQPMLLGYALQNQDRPAVPGDGQGRHGHMYER